MDLAFRNCNDWMVGWIFFALNQQTRTIDLDSNDLFPWEVRWACHKY